MLSRVLIVMELSQMVGVRAFFSLALATACWILSKSFGRAPWTSRCSSMMPVAVALLIIAYVGGPFVGVLEKVPATCSGESVALECAGREQA